MKFDSLLLAIFRIYYLVKTTPGLAPNLRGLNPLFINGTVAFIIRMAKDTPSGYAPYILIKIVSNPTPNPKMSCPPLVIGEVTISVAINIAPSNIPPVNIWNIGSA